MKKIFKKIRAFFNNKGKQETLDLIAAEISEAGIILHPENDSEHSFYVQSTAIEAIELFINPQSELSEDDIYILDNKKIYEPKQSEPTKSCNTVFEQSRFDAILEQDHSSAVFAQNSSEILPGSSRPRISPNTNSADATRFREKHSSQLIPLKKRFSVMLYQDEYDMVMKNIEENKYKKVEYFLACISSAKKQSMQATYNHYKKTRAERHKETRRLRAEERLNQTSHLLYS